MKLVFLLCLLIGVNNARAGRKFYRGHTVGYDIPPPADDVQTRDDDDRVTINYFQQRLDHYDPTNTDTWRQRYYVNEAYYNSTKRDVAFLMISGEGEATIRWITSGSWIETAQKYNGLLFQLEHRFYGDSHPFSDLSTENLRYLSTPQALEDLATFITAMNVQYELASDVKWIVFGGSYAGSLAAWLRQKYPHLVRGAMSASGPLHAQIDFPEYFDVVVADLALYSQECVDVVKTAVSQIENVLTNPTGDLNLTSIFNFCDDVFENVNKTSDMAALFGVIADNFAGVAQYNKNAGRTTSIDDLCDILTNDTIGSEIHRLAEVVELVSGTDCLDYKYESAVNELKNTTITTSGNMRQWIYQTCTEYGWYQTSSQKNHVFGDRFPLDFFTQQCIDVYGEEFNKTFINESNNHINIHFGGYDIDVSNVVFVHGSYDPWHPMGLTKTTNPDSPVIFIEGTAHCANMYNISDDDLPQLTEARAEINRLIGVWLGLEVPSAANINFSVSLYVVVLALFNLRSMF